MTREQFEAEREKQPPEKKGVVIDQDGRRGRVMFWDNDQVVIKADNDGDIGVIAFDQVIPAEEWEKRGLPTHPDEEPKTRKGQ